MDLTDKAGKVYSKNFSAKTWFGRCIFLSWYCDVATCKFCFRATIKHKIKHAKKAKRSLASILADTILAKALGWRIEFLTGGYKIFSFDEMLGIIKKVHKIYKKKLWINLGLMNSSQLEKLKPYVEGVCASIETTNRKLHDELCPDKPIEPYEGMLELAGELGFKKSITIVVGLNEKKEDIDLLFDFIERHRLDRITFYALKPVKGSPFKKSPKAEYYAWWIARTRIRFPKLEIIAGLTPKRPDYTGLILASGANAITKFPVVKKFNSEETKLIEKQIKEAGRELTGSLTNLPKIDFDKEVNKLNLNKDLKEQIKIKLNQHLRKMGKCHHSQI